MVRAIVAALVAAILTGCAAAPDAGPTQAPSISDRQAGLGRAIGGAEAKGVVTRVVDGDTIKVRLDTKPLLVGQVVTVRLILVDTPETVHPRVPDERCGVESTEVMRELLPVGEKVKLVYDRDRVDERNGYRTLAYAVRERDRLDVGHELLTQGLAEVKVFPPNTARLAEYRVAEDQAHEALLGLWGSATCRVLLSETRKAS